MQYVKCGASYCLLNVILSVFKQLPYCILIFNKSRLNNNFYCNSYPFIRCQSNLFLPIKVWLNCSDVCGYSLVEIKFLKLSYVNLRQV